MALTGVKFDDGSGIYATNCFPVKSLIRSGAEDVSGAWLIAQKAEQRRRFKAVLCAKPRTFARIKEERKKSEYHGTNLMDHVFEDEEEVEDDSAVLDGFYLMKHCCVEDPSDLCSVNIVGKELCEVKEEDLALFDNVAYVNAGENLLPFEAFRGFEALRELEMPLNGLRNIKLNMGDFPQLELVDLSYNNLSHDDVLMMGILPNLKILHLTGNNFKTLPPDMALPFVSPDGTTQFCRFPKLEVLLLDENKFCDMDVFASLAGLPRLRHLNMEKNEIFCVPKLQLLEGKVISQDTKMKPQKKSSSRRGMAIRRPRSTHENLISEEKTIPEEPAESEMMSTQLEATEHKVIIEAAELTEISGSTPKVPPTTNSEVSDKHHGGKTPNVSRAVTETEGFSENILDDDFAAAVDKVSSIHLDGTSEDAYQGSNSVIPSGSSNSLPLYKPPEASQPPFPELRYLNLAHNKICEEEALLAVAAWPMLVELVINDNPLTTEHKGDPPLLQRFLHERLGIHLVRKKKPMVVKPHVEVQAKKSRTVKSTVPKVPKVSIEDRLMLEAPPQPPGLTMDVGDEQLSSGLETRKPLPPINRTTERPLSAGNTPKSTGDKDVGEKMVPPAVDAWSEEVKEDNEDAFFMTQVDGQEEESRGPTTEVESKKKNRRKKNKDVPNRYKGYEILLDVDETEPDYIPPPKDIQGSIRALKYALDHELVYRDAAVHLDKVSKEVPARRRVPMPPKEPHKSRRERVDDALQNLKTRTTTVEEQLDKVLGNHRKFGKTFPDGQQLLTDVQRRYNAVRVSSMKEAREGRKLIQETIDDVQMKLESLRGSQKSARMSERSTLITS